MIFKYVESVCQSWLEPFFELAARLHNDYAGAGQQPVLTQEPVH